jgi:hypothetical protein
MFFHVNPYHGLTILTRHIALLAILVIPYKYFLQKETILQRVTAKDHTIQIFDTSSLHLFVSVMVCCSFDFTESDIGLFAGFRKAS